MLYLILSSNINAKSNKIKYDPTRSYINYSSTMVSSHTIHDDSALHPQDQSRQDSSYCWWTLHLEIFSWYDSNTLRVLDSKKKLKRCLESFTNISLGSCSNIVLFSCFFFGNTWTTSTTHRSRVVSLRTAVEMLGIPWLGNPRWIVAQLFGFDGNGSRPGVVGKLQPTAVGSRTLVGGPLNAKFEACVF